DFALDAADTLDFRNAAHALQRPRNRVVDEPGQLLGRHRRRARRVGDDRQTFDVEALRDRLVDCPRQLAANARNGVLHIVDSAIDRGFEVELDQCGRATLDDCRSDVLNAGNACDGVFNAFCDLGFQLRRCCARLRDGDLHHRDIDVRKAHHRELLEAEHPQRDEHHEQHERGHRTTDRPGRDVESGHRQRTSLTVLVGSKTGRTSSPSRRKVPERAITTSPSARPSTISTRPPALSPVFTRRVLTRPSVTTWTLAPSGPYRTALAGMARPRPLAVTTVPRAKPPIRSGSLLVRLMRTRPSRVLLSISGETSRTLPVISPRPATVTEAG